MAEGSLKISFGTTVPDLPVNFSEEVSVGSLGEQKLGDRVELTLTPAWTIGIDELASLLSYQRRASCNVNICLYFQSLLVQENAWVWLTNQCCSKHEEKLPKKAPARMTDTVRESVWSKSQTNAS